MANLNGFNAANVDPATDYDPIAAYNALSSDEQRQVLEQRQANGLSIEGLVPPGDVPVDAPQRVATGGRIPAGQ